MDGIQHNITFGRLRRRYYVKLPTGQNSGQIGRSPCVLVFHGGGSNSEDIQHCADLDRWADGYGYIVVYIDGTTGRIGQRYTYNAGTCCPDATSRRVDDVGCVAKVIDEIVIKYPINPARVFATGFSNGAMLCYRLAAEIPRRLKAIAPVSGDMGVPMPANPVPVPLMHFHGLLDNQANGYCPFEGGVGARSLTKTPHKPIPEVIEGWVRANQCRRTPDTESAPDYIRDTYPGAFPVVLYKLPQGGHEFPGGKTNNLPGQNLVTTVPAAKLMLEWFGTL